MHAACAEDNRCNNGVLKAARMGGFLAVLPAGDGVRLAEGEEWAPFPLGSSRLPSCVLQRRAEALAANRGIPPLPDWKRLAALRSQMFRCAERQRQGGIAALQSATEGEPREPQAILADAPEPAWPSRRNGFCEMLSNFIEPALASTEEIHASILAITDLDHGFDGMINQLHPRDRRKLFETGYAALAGSQKKTAAGTRKVLQDLSSKPTL